MWTLKEVDIKHRNILEKILKAVLLLIYFSFLIYCFAVMKSSSFGVESYFFYLINAVCLYWCWCFIFNKKMVFSAVTIDVHNKLPRILIFMLSLPLFVFTVYLALRGGQ